MWPFVHVSFAPATVQIEDLESRMLLSGAGHANLLRAPPPAVSVAPVVHKATPATVAKAVKVKSAHKSGEVKSTAAVKAKKKPAKKPQRKSGEKKHESSDHHHDHGHHGGGGLSSYDVSSYDESSTSSEQSGGQEDSQHDESSESSGSEDTGNNNSSNDSGSSDSVEYYSGEDPYYDPNPGDGYYGS